MVVLNVTRASGTFGSVTLPVVVNATTNSALMAATPDADYTVLGGVPSLFFAEGQRIAQITLRIVDDSIPELAETFTVALGAPSSGQLGGVQSIEIIINRSDNPNGVFAFASATQPAATELDGADSVSNVRVVRAFGGFGEIKVSWSLQPVSGITLGAGVSPTSGVVTFAPDQQTADIVLTVLPDNLPELDEKYIVTLTSVDGGASFGSPASTNFTVTASDDPSGVVAFADLATLEVSESGGNAVLALQRTAGLFGRLTVAWSAQPDGGATYVEPAADSPRLFFAVQGLSNLGWYQRMAQLCVTADCSELFVFMGGADAPDVAVLRWNGQTLVSVMTLPMPSVTGIKLFRMNNAQYAAFSSATVGSGVVSITVSGAESDTVSVSLLQSIAINASCVCAFTDAAQNQYLLLVGVSSGPVRSPLLRWNAATSQFVQVQDVRISRAADVTAVSVDGAVFVAGAGEGAVSDLYQLRSGSLLFADQAETQAATTWATFVAGGVTYACIANAQGPLRVYQVTSAGRLQSPQTVAGLSNVTFVQTFVPASDPTALYILASTALPASQVTILRWNTSTLALDTVSSFATASTAPSSTFAFESKDGSTWYIGVQSASSGLDVYRGVKVAAGSDFAPNSGVVVFEVSCCFE